MAYTQPELDYLASSLQKIRRSISKKVADKKKIYWDGSIYSINSSTYYVISRNKKYTYAQVNNNNKTSVTFLNQTTGIVLAICTQQDCLSNDNVIINNPDFSSFDANNFNHKEVAFTNFNVLVESFEGFLQLLTQHPDVIVEKITFVVDENVKNFYANNLKKVLQQ